MCYTLAVMIGRPKEFDRGEVLEKAMRVFWAQGYETTAVQELVQNMGVGPAVLHKTPPTWPVQGSLDERFTEPVIQDENVRTDIELLARWRDQGDVEVPRPYYGFDDVMLTIGHGDFVRGHYQTWLAERHPEPHTLRGSKHALPTERDLHISQAWRTRVPEALYPTTYITEQTVQYLERYAASGTASPFFLFSSFPDPHHPFVPPGRYFDLYAPDDIPLSPAWDNTHERTPPHMQALVKELGTPEAVRHTPAAFAVNAAETRQAMALTYGMISMIDDGVGRILDTLARLGLADNTVVLFTSDHGDLMGDHQLMLKGPCHFQGLIRVPLLIQVPGMATGTVTHALASTIDLPQTILELAGLDPSPRMQGRSLVPLLADPTTAVRDHILIEDDGPRPLLEGSNQLRRDPFADYHDARLEPEIPPLLKQCPPVLLPEGQVSLHSRGLRYPFFPSTMRVDINVPEHNMSDPMASLPPK